MLAFPPYNQSLSVQSILWMPPLFSWLLSKSIGLGWAWIYIASSMSESLLLPPSCQSGEAWPALSLEYVQLL